MHSKISRNMLCRTVKVTVDEDIKYTAAAKGKDAAIDQTLEFILGRKEINAHEDLSVDLEVWDYRLINHFKVMHEASWHHVACSHQLLIVFFDRTSQV